ncbi:MAG: metal-dependent hydrolase [Acidobacteria bacterium]|nr:metal-dependent hydrolase [Acidobacteriota bacterium]
MPTPVGHALGGLATAWFAGAAARKPLPGRGVALTCAIAAVLPDLDILVDSHRTYTHSIGAIVIVGLMAWIAVRTLTPFSLRIALTIAAAYGSHLLLDWMGMDNSTPPGMMALWPFSSRFYISGIDFFGEVSRRYWNPDEFIIGNLRVAAWEVLALGPVAGIAWWLQHRRSGGTRMLHLDG